MVTASRSGKAQGAARVIRIRISAGIVGDLARRGVVVRFLRSHTMNAVSHKSPFLIGFSLVPFLSGGQEKVKRVPEKVLLGDTFGSDT